MYNSGRGNFKEIGLPEELGRSGGQIQSEKKAKELLSNMTFVDQSVTGMFERRYTINELENNNNK